MSGQTLANAITELEANGVWTNEGTERPAAPKHLCAACRDRHARFHYRGVVKADRAHTLCFRCFRAELNRQRVRRTLIAPAVTERLLPVEERERLLARRRRRAQIAARHVMAEHG